MREVTSRLVMLAEAVLVIAPVACIWVVGSYAAVAGHMSPTAGLGASSLIEVAVALACVVPLIALSVLALAFMLGGARALRRRGALPWVCACMGCLFILLAFVLPWVVKPVPYSPEADMCDRVSLMALGMPLLLPLAHLASERKYRQPMNEGCSACGYNTRGNCGTCPECGCAVGPLPPHAAARAVSRNAGEPPCLDG